MNRSLLITVAAVSSLCGSALHADVIVQNSSFEDAPFPNGANVGYGAVTDWPQTSGDTGNTGVNAAGGPFLNGHTIPDGTHVAFVQGTGNISQVLTGVDPGQLYSVTYFVNERGNSGQNANGTGGSLIDTSASMNGNTTSNADSVDVVSTPAWRRVVSGPLSASGATDGQLVINSFNPVGDSTLLIDQVSVTRAVPAIVNNGFEHSFTAQDGSSQNGQIVTDGTQGHFAERDTPYGWNLVEGAAGVIQNNSAYSAPPMTEGSQAALLKGTTGISQPISGFEPGVTYSLSFAGMPRPGFDPQVSVLTVLVGGVVIDTINMNSSTQNNWQEFTTADFTVTSPDETLTFQNTANPLDTHSGDDSIYLDDARFNFVAEVPEPGSLALIAAAFPLLVRRRSARIPERG